MREIQQAIGRRDGLKLATAGLIGLGTSALLGRSALGQPAWLGAFGALHAAARKEGALNLIADPPDWANYGALMATFEKDTGLKVNDANPNGTSAEELQAIRSLKGQARAPDTIDVGPSFAVTATEQKLLASYKVAAWDSIPDQMKHPDGFWYGGYFGIISFGVNTAVAKRAPQSWSDLKKPDYKGMVALGGSPLASASAFASVYAAALGNGGSLDDIEPGIRFFGELAQRGNLSPAAATPASLISGQTPIYVNWDYLSLAYRKQAEGKTPIEVTVPSDSPAFGNFYVQAISAYAPHPQAARLWEEFLYSDEGQLLLLAGYAHPARFSALVAAGKVPDELLKQLPPAEAYKNLRFPTQEQSAKAQKAVADLWPRLVKS